MRRHADVRHRRGRSTPSRQCATGSRVGVLRDGERLLNVVELPGTARRDREAVAMTAHDKQIGGDHYKTLAIQPSEFIAKNKLGWYEGNAVKYIVRHRIKGGKQDIEKAIHYLEL